MRHRPAAGVVGLFAILGGLVVPAPAAAQWYFGTFTGANHTTPATVVIQQPAANVALRFEDVTFQAKPFTSPQYYGARIGHLFGTGGLGLEVEFLHIKVIAQTDRPFHVTGQDGAGPVDLTLPMRFKVQRYAMSHGLNFWLANVVWRRPLGHRGRPSPVTAVVRAGIGPVVPGVDSVVDNVSVQGYQYAGFGGQLAAGLDVRLGGRLSATVEYKLTRTRPELDIAAGTGRTTAVSHHLAAGVAFGFSRR